MSDTITETETHVSIDLPSFWGVKFHNDDFTPIDFVIAIVIKFFNKSEDEAAVITMQIHDQGAAVVGMFTRDIAETKVAHITGISENSNHPLRVEAVPV